jgi:hypothetical protein
VRQSSVQYQNEVRSKFEGLKNLLEQYPEVSSEVLDGSACDRVVFGRSRPNVPPF